MNDKELLKLIDSTYSNVESPLGRELAFLLDPKNRGVDKGTSPLEAMLKAISTPNILSGGGQFSSLMGRYQLDETPREAKSIDQIMKEADLAEFLAKAVSTDTNVESKGIKDETIGRVTSGGMLQGLAQEQEPIPTEVFSRLLRSLGGGTIGRVDSDSTMSILAGEQEPVPRR
tara:strand:- start:8205 stop:8723 length:519 start_codon:yes stop_codon:yes gene_type:complete